MPIQNTITVITICFNNLQDLMHTCISVDQQERKPFEHLIIDGSTNDEIKNYLEYNPQPAFRKWICEPDEGISDAFNKGIINAAGTIVVMMNAGDSFYDEYAIATAKHTFDEDQSIQWLHSKYKLFRGGQWVVIGKPFKKAHIYRGMRSVNHQSMFVKKELHEKHGLYFIDQKVSMDYDFLCRIAGEPFAFLKNPLVVFAPNGASSTRYPQSLMEIKAAHEKYFGKSILQSFWQLRLRLLFHLLKTRPGKFAYRIMTLLKLENL
jgi:glycosyltransferase involved in cell wall biosynthesis